MLHPKEAESASFDCFLTKNRLTEEAESASFDSPARIGLRGRFCGRLVAKVGLNPDITGRHPAGSGRFNRGRVKQAE